MRWYLSKRHQDPAFELPSRRQPEIEPPQQGPEGILALQRSAGNQAVQKLMPHREGDPIPEDERRNLEAGFGRDLSNVRIHRDQEAATEEGATAFTTCRRCCQRERSARHAAAARAGSTAICFKVDADVLAHPRQFRHQ